MFVFAVFSPRLLLLLPLLAFPFIPGLLAVAAGAETPPAPADSLKNIHVSPTEKKEFFPDSEPLSPVRKRQDESEEQKTSPSRNPQGFSLPLPPDLPLEQQQTALIIIGEVEPRIRELHQQMRETLLQLHNLSFAPETPPEELGILGRRLVAARNAIIEEIQHLSARLEKEAGFDPGWDSRRICSLHLSEKDK